MRRLFLFIGSALALAACAESKPKTKPVSVPPPVIKPAPQPAPPAKPVLVQPSGPWLDWPLAPGEWVYRKDDRGSIALFGPAGGEATVILRCDRDRGSLFLSRAGTGPATMTIRTSSVSRDLAAQSTGGKPAYAATTLSPNDPLLDAMAFSRGRIAVEMSGAQYIAIPAWAEMGRVTEDCRR
jgi:hypothetical protein